MTSASGLCHGPSCPSPIGPGAVDGYFCSEQCQRRWTAEQNGVLLGRQDPTFLWVPEYKSSAGLEVIQLAKEAGLFLDPWQQWLLIHAFAEDEFGAWLTFENGIVLSRQNGKDALVEAAELAWLFLFGERMIIHSAHLFETSRQHFLRIVSLIKNHDDFRRRVRRVREGRGSEEIELLDGAILKFMTRKGGAGRGFTAAKVVMNEAMYLDSEMMAAGLPTVATIPNAQVWYLGSAGLKHSTQLALVRRRAYARDDPALMYAEWAIDERTEDDDGNPLTPDDRSDPRTWAKVNPGYGPHPVGRITESYVRKEARALGGVHSVGFGTERLGVGDWPEEDEAWEVIGKGQWEAILDKLSEIAPGGKVAFGVDADPVGLVGTIAVYGLREDGRGHLETAVRHRGIAWIPDWLVARAKPLPGRTRPLLKVCAVVLLSDGAVSSLIKPLKDAKLPVHSPTSTEYRQGCGDLYTAIVERDSVRQMGQPSMSAAVGGARKRTSREGGWSWDPGAPTDQAPLKGVTLAKWGFENFASVGGGFAKSMDELGAPLEEPAVTGRGATGYAAIVRGIQAGRP